MVGDLKTWMAVIHTVSSVLSLLLLVLLENAGRRAEEAAQEKLNVLAEALSDLMASRAQDDPGLDDAVQRLRDAVGLEARHSCRPVPRLGLRRTMDEGAGCDGRTRAQVRRRGRARRRLAGHRQRPRSELSVAETAPVRRDGGLGWQRRPGGADGAGGVVRRLRSSGARRRQRRPGGPGAGHSVVAPPLRELHRAGAGRKAVGRHAGDVRVDRRIRRGHARSSSTSTRTG